MNKNTFGQRINNWLDEPEGQTFKAGKWRFWFLALIALSILNAILTASIFGSGKQSFIGSITLAVGALVAWLCVGTLHYSDSRDARLARGVSILDSIALCFVIAHFCFLLWAQGHLLTIQAQEADYKLTAATYNEKAEKISIDNARIAEAARQIAQEETKRARIENDTIYQARKAAQAGAIVSTQRGSQSLTPSLSTSPIELEKPEKPKETSAAFLMKWDGWIRATNFGELILAAITLIFIRNRSAKNNVRNIPIEEPFPSELEIENRGSSRRENFTKKKETAKKHAPSVSVIDPEGLKRLRETLKDISFHLPGLSFKSQVRGDAIWILMVRANKGTQETVASAKAKLSILTDAMTMPRDAFRGRLEKFLREHDFEIELAP